MLGGDLDGIEEYVQEEAAVVGVHFERPEEQPGSPCCQPRAPPDNEDAPVAISSAPSGFRLTTEHPGEEGAKQKR